MLRAFILLIAFLIAGCVTAPASLQFPVSPTMATSYADGETSIAWKTEINQTYTVYYTDAPYGTRADWKPLPQANNLRGNGKQITIRDKVGSDSPRRYMLLSGNQKP